MGCQLVRMHPGNYFFREIVVVHEKACNFRVYDQLNDRPDAVTFVYDILFV